MGIHSTYMFPNLLFFYPTLHHLIPVTSSLIISHLKEPSQNVAIKTIAKKNLGKTQSLLGKEIRILKVSNIFLASTDFSKYLAWFMATSLCSYN